MKVLLLKKIAPVLGAAVSLFMLSTGLAHAEQCGQASWYALTSKTASGEQMNPTAMTAAHRNLPLGSRIRVVNKDNGKSVVVRVNDRGPYAKGRILDLSKGAAQQLGFINAGHTNVCYEPLS